MDLHLTRQRTCREADDHKRSEVGETRAAEIGQRLGVDLLLPIAAPPARQCRSHGIERTPVVGTLRST